MVARRATLFATTEVPMAEPTTADLQGGATPTREELLVAHAEARRRRNEAPLGSEAWAEAAKEVGRIEVEIARIEREMDPPRV